MPVIKGFSTTKPNKMKEALAYFKSPVPLKFLKKAVVKGIEYDVKCIGTKVDQPKAGKVIVSKKAKVVKTVKVVNKKPIKKAVKKTVKKVVKKKVKNKKK